MDLTPIPPMGFIKVRWPRQKIARQHPLFSPFYLGGPKAHLPYSHIPSTLGRLEWRDEQVWWHPEKKGEDLESSSQALSRETTLFQGRFEPSYSLQYYDLEYLEIEVIYIPPSPGQEWAVVDFRERSFTNLEDLPDGDAICLIDQGNPFYRLELFGKFLYEKWNLASSGQERFSSLLFEMLHNAWTHGNHLREDLSIELKILLQKNTLFISVKDQGKGFPLSETLLLPAEFTPKEKENRHRRPRYLPGGPGGLGLLAMQKLVEEICQNELGNEITLVYLVKQSQG